MTVTRPRYVAHRYRQPRHMSLPNASSKCARRSLSEIAHHKMRKPWRRSVGRPTVTIHDGRTPRLSVQWLRVDARRSRQRCARAFGAVCDKATINIETGRHGQHKSSGSGMLYTHADRMPSSYNHAFREAVSDNGRKTRRTAI